MIIAPDKVITSKSIDIVEDEHGHELATVTKFTMLQFANKRVKMLKRSIVFYTLVLNAYVHFQIISTKSISPQFNSEIEHKPSLCLCQNPKPTENRYLRTQSRLSNYSLKTDMEFASPQIKVKKTRTPNLNKTATKVETSFNKVKRTPVLPTSKPKSKLQTPKKRENKQQVHRGNILEKKVTNSAPLSETKIYYVTFNNDKELEEYDFKKIFGRQESSVDDGDATEVATAEETTTETNTSEDTTTTTTTATAITTTKKSTTTQSSGNFTINYEVNNTTYDYSAYGPSNGNEHISITYSPLDQDNYYNQPERYLYSPQGTQDHFQYNHYFAQ
ncbi:hypothetical protein RN001_016289 [Aquatica leii]|uniref:Uncharacterized protein n=1 Tax=Aquatica leii TaxID=1421715 RepID=A0AAN7PY88_9COLE|nr:hypothetical protein RN001_016289 [Aquatica leii]